MLRLNHPELACASIPLEMYVACACTVCADDVAER